MIFTCLIDNGAFWSKELILWKGTTMILGGMHNDNVENINGFSIDEAINHLEKTGYIKVMSVKKMEISQC
jgi:hypothetical protein